MSDGREPVGTPVTCGRSAPGPSNRKGAAGKMEADPVFLGRFGLRRGIHRLRAVIAALDTRLRNDLATKGDRSTGTGAAVECARDSA